MPVPTTPPALPPAQSSDELLERYSYSSWSGLFQRADLVPAVVVPLEEDFLDYLRGDGMQLPVECEEEMSVESQLSESDDDDDDDQVDAESYHPPSFPSLINRISTAIKDLSLSPYASSISGVFPKLNFSAPQDAAFLLPRGDGLLRCKTAGDVVMLLKGSGAVAWDLAVLDGLDVRGQGGEGKVEALRKAMDRLSVQTRDGTRGKQRKAGELVLKRWTHLDPAAEFRAFVRERRLLGAFPPSPSPRVELEREAAICTRTTLFAGALVNPDVQRSVIERISAFFEASVRSVFPDESYTFDVHLSSLTAHSPSRKLTLLDFNPFSAPTSPLLFTWPSLLDLHLSPPTTSLPVLKLVSSEEEEEDLTPKGGKWAREKVPYELVDYSADGGDVAEIAQRWNRAMARAARDG